MRAGERSEVSTSRSKEHTMPRNVTGILIVVILVLLVVFLVTRL